MKALILNNQVVDVANSEFPVAGTLIWMDCPDDCKAYRWSIIDGVLQENPEPDASANWQPSTYAEKRAQEYPPIVDQLDDIYHNGIDAWKATIKVTKDKYPK